MPDHPFRFFDRMGSPGQNRCRYQRMAERFNWFQQKCQACNAKDTWLVQPGGSILSGEITSLGHWGNFPEFCFNWSHAGRCGCTIIPWLAWSNYIKLLVFHVDDCWLEAYVLHFSQWMAHMSTYPHLISRPLEPWKCWPTKPTAYCTGHSLNFVCQVLVNFSLNSLSRPTFWATHTRQHPLLCSGKRPGKPRLCLQKNMVPRSCFFVELQTMAA